MEKKEIWMDVPGYESIYKVSNLGNLKSLNYNHTKKEKLISNKSINKSGYCGVSLYKNKKKRQYNIHQLVAMAFLGHKIEAKGLVVNHINFNKIDNRVENLELVTSRENGNLKHKKSTSKYVGVSWDNTHKKYRARINVNKFDESLGLYSCEKKASDAYQRRLAELLQTKL